MPRNIYGWSREPPSSPKVAVSGSNKVGNGVASNLGISNDGLGVSTYNSVEIPQVPRSKKGVSLIETLEGFVTVGQAMGYSMDGCIHNIEETISTQGAHHVDKWIFFPLMCKAMMTRRLGSVTFIQVSFELYFVTGDKSGSSWSFFYSVYLG